MRSQPLNVVWFDDMLSQIEDVRESLQKHSVNVTAFDNADELRDHLTAVVRQGLGGHLKTGQSGTPQNRPVGVTSKPAS
jgi:hypothetical protein